MTELFGHIQFDAKSKQLSRGCQTLFIRLKDAIEQIPFNSSRKKALEKLKECSMWTNDAIRDEQEDREHKLVKTTPTLKVQKMADSQ